MCNYLSHNNKQNIITGIYYFSFLLHESDVQTNQIHTRKFLVFVIQASKQEVFPYQVSEPRTAFWQ